MKPVASLHLKKERAHLKSGPHVDAHASLRTVPAKSGSYSSTPGNSSSVQNSGFSDSRFLMNTYARYPVSLVSGNGCRVCDKTGKTFLDMIGGIACVPLGHAHPRFVESVQRHALGLTNASNLFHTENAARLAGKLCAISGMDRAFFSNSGTEANEAALKLAMAATGKKRFIACTDAFHGRSLGSLSATFEPKYRKPFEPLSPPVDFVPYGDVAAIKAALTPRTAAVIVEPIQGESGVIVPPENYLLELLELCESKDVLLIADEVQSGNGRTGTYFEYLSHGGGRFKPHIVTTAKGLANGLPIGATLARGIDLDFKPGQHGSTFGGNSFVTGVASDVLDLLQKEKLMENAVLQGNRIQAAISQMNKKSVSAVRGKGLMIGIQMDGAAKPAMEALRPKGVLVNVAHDCAIRLLPPLVLSNNDVNEFVGAFNEVVV
ncbi:acetylornithine/succinylornithine family transaminase [Candidatus Micrarchaeota archaeon]|nr:acetylornithine/succinylornithine family transaminase [Candidatus Micrarchaeota archaeon]